MNTLLKYDEVNYEKNIYKATKKMENMQLKQTKKTQEINRKINTFGTDFNFTIYTVSLRIILSHNK